MFNWLQGWIVSGIAKKLNAETVQKGLVTVWEGLKKVPGLNIPTILIKVGEEAGDRWEEMPDEKKQEFFEAAVAALTKAMLSYAKK